MYGTINESPCPARLVEASLPKIRISPTSQHGQHRTQQQGRMRVTSRTWSKSMLSVVTLHEIPAPPHLRGRHDGPVWEIIRCFVICG